MANAASGITVHDDCKRSFLELKSKRTHRYIVFKIDDSKQVVVEKLGKRDDEKQGEQNDEKLDKTAQDYANFTTELPPNDCRYAIYDYDFISKENVQKSKIFFIAWSPDTGKVRSKMLYASSKERFKRELDGIQVELQATDPTEMDLDTIKERAK